MSELPTHKPAPMTVNEMTISGACFNSHAWII
jgi:hypothetical protein